MANPEELINKFYSAFQQRDHAGMNACYSSDIVFFDPVFGLLEGDQVRYMWEMLCTSAKDLEITYGNIVHLDEEYSTCDWVANYTFSRTGRKVVNKIKAHMRFSGGQIVEHSDAFSLHKWSAQAMGFSGWLLGWNSIYQGKIKNAAKRNLLEFMKKKTA
jgi:ketosteroid isomerase-like protein